MLVGVGLIINRSIDVTLALALLIHRFQSCVVSFKPSCPTTLILGHHKSCLLLFYQWDVLLGSNCFMLNSFGSTCLVLLSYLSRGRTCLYQPTFLEKMEFGSIFKRILIDSSPFVTLGLLIMPHFIVVIIWHSLKSKKNKISIQRTGQNSNTFIKNKEH